MFRLKSQNKPKKKKTSIFEADDTPTTGGEDFEESFLKEVQDKKRKAEIQLDQVSDLDWEHEPVKSDPINPEPEVEPKSKYIHKLLAAKKLRDQDKIQVEQKEINAKRESGAMVFESTAYKARRGVIEEDIHQQETLLKPEQPLDQSWEDIVISLNYDITKFKDMLVSKITAQDVAGYKQRYEQRKQTNQ